MPEQWCVMLREHFAELTGPRVEHGELRLGLFDHWIVRVCRAVRPSRANSPDTAERRVLCACLRLPPLVEIILNSIALKRTRLVTVVLPN